MPPSLIDRYHPVVSLPRILTAIGRHHKVVERDGWRLLTPRHAPADDLAGHLTFALKYEGLDLAVLGRLFATAGPALSAKPGAIRSVRMSSCDFRRSSSTMRVS